MPVGDFPDQESWIWHDDTWNKANQNTQVPTLDCEGCEHFAVLSKYTSAQRPVQLSACVQEGHDTHMTAQVLKCTTTAPWHSWHTERLNSQCLEVDRRAKKELNLMRLH